MGQISVNFYTDPLCCWSFAFENEWRQLQLKHPGKIALQYIMCGMIPSWAAFNDPMNSVSNPLQMGPLWMHAAEVTHTKIAYNIWHEDPPSSSYPACIAVKTAGLQSPAAEEQYLSSVRLAVMQDARNISKPDVLLAVAEALDRDGVLSYAQFKDDWQRGKGKAPFRSDLEKASYHKIGRYPTLTFKRGDGRGIMITGYRPYHILEQAYSQIASTGE